MAKIDIVCIKNQVTYPEVRKAMVEGARTKEDLKTINVCGECEGCQEYLDYILSTLCGCQEVKMKLVQDLVQSGHSSREEIMKITKAGSQEDCGRCQALIDSVIELGY